MTTALHYVSGETIIPKGSFGISPSGVSKFIEKTHEWYQEMLLGNKTFNGSTATVLGSIVHFCAEQFILYKKVDYNEIYNYIFTQTCLLKPDEEFLALTTEESKIDYLLNNCNSTEIDATYILEQWRPMGQTLINYLIKSGIPEQAEPMVKAEVIPGYWASGSIDAIKGLNNGSGMIIDYKTTSDKTVKQYIPMHYKYQLLTYAWICKQNNMPIDRISIIWVTNNDINRISEVTGKPMKDYPAQAVQIIEQVTEADYQFIESILTMIASTVAASKAHPELTWLLFKDPRLRITND